MALYFISPLLILLSYTYFFLLPFLSALGNETVVEYITTTEGKLNVIAVHEDGPDKQEEKVK